MAIRTLIDYVRGFVLPGEREGDSDGELLSQFQELRDESAFAVLVHRHGPMVLGVCQRVLTNPDDALDAFQATFLVFAQKATSIRKRHSVACWLYCTALRVARKANVTLARRRVREAHAESVPCEAVPTDLEQQETLAILDDELSRLPSKYRDPIVLCYLQGKTNEEAARLLGWTKGTVSGRIARAKEELRQRLTVAASPSRARGSRPCSPHNEHRLPFPIGSPRGRRRASVRF